MVFKTEKQLAEWLRSRQPQSLSLENELSDEFLVDEAYQLGEWNFNEKNEYVAVIKSKKKGK
tara:strand:+ start:625 stop:810 length:186 start_codon:yes stop_codon:yes gene_type:complete